MTTPTMPEVTEADFASGVLAAEGRVLVEFYATWCGNCRRMAPVLDRLAEELAAEAGFVKVNAEEAPGLVAEYGVTSTPTLIVFDRGAPGARLVGAQSERAVRDLVVGRAESGGVKTQLPLSWVPVDACRLPSADQPMRLAAFEDLFATAVRSVDRVEPTLLRLDLVPDPAVAARAAELAVRESDCCGFFHFDLTAAEGALTLNITVTADRSIVLDGLADQARSAQAGAVA